MRSASALALLLAVAVAVTAAVWTTVDAAASAPPVDAPAPPSAGEVDATDLSRNAAGRVVLGETPFTGTRVAREAGALVERSAYAGGLRHGLTERWDADGALRYRASYRHGRRDGTVEAQPDRRLNPAGDGLGVRRIGPPGRDGGAEGMIQNRDGALEHRCRRRWIRYDLHRGVHRHKPGITHHHER